MPTKAEVIELCQDDSIELVRLMWVDNAGIERGYSVSGDDIEASFENGVNIPPIQQAFTDFDVPTAAGPWGATGEVRKVPDPASFRALPYAERTAGMLCDIYNLDRTPWDADPRLSLKSFIDNLDYEVEAAFEPEWYLMREIEDGGIEPADRSGCFALDGHQSAHPIILDIVDALKEQDMDVSVYYPEYGPSQQEVVIDHAPGVRAADNHIFYKQTVKAIAARHGLRATFVPKPLQDGPGSGCHTHISLWDEGSNLFYEEQGSSYDISDECRHFIGGLLEHASALVALTASSIPSYKRLRPHMWASAYIAWGFDNREAVVRVPSSKWGDPETSTRIEWKPADNIANPYVGLLGILAAGMDGIDRELDPRGPAEIDPASMSEDERERLGIERLPKTLGEALDALEEDAVLAEAMGDELFESYVAAKRAVWEEFTGDVTDWEIERYIQYY